MRRTRPPDRRHSSFNMNVRCAFPVAPIRFLTLRSYVVDEAQCQHFVRGNVKRSDAFASKLRGIYRWRKEESTMAIVCKTQQLEGQTEIRMGGGYNIFANRHTYTDCCVTCQQQHDEGQASCRLADELMEGMHSHTARPKEHGGEGERVVDICSFQRHFKQGYRMGRFN